MGIRSTNRQRWIEELREEITDFVAACTVALRSVNDIAKRQVKGGISQEQADKMGADILGHRREIESLHTRIALRLNSAEDTHKALLDALVGARRTCFAGYNQSIKDFADCYEERRKDFDGLRLKILGNDKLILKMEWERVKRGE